MSPDTLSSWRSIEREESERARALSIDFMREASNNSNPAKQKMSTRWRILPEWRKYLVEQMLKDKNSEIFLRVGPPEVFPKDKRGNDACLPIYI